MEIYVASVSLYLLLILLDSKKHEVHTNLSQQFASYIHYHSLFSETIRFTFLKKVILLEALKIWRAVYDREKVRHRHLAIRFWTTQTIFPKFQAPLNSETVFGVTTSSMVIPKKGGVPQTISN